MDKIIPVVIFISLSLISLFLLPSPSAHMWDDSCKHAIENLKKAQEKVSGAYGQLNTAESSAETAKYFYHLCSSSESKNCESERMQLDNSLEEYNFYLNQLNNVLTGFKDGVNHINESCLE
jgi:uncharacterized phage infection (PIP) family protein YhgE